MAHDSKGSSDVKTYLRKNGQSMKESEHYARYPISSGAVYNQGSKTSKIIPTKHYIAGGRTLGLHLDRGDTLDLFCDDCSAGIYHNTFCVSLATFDIE